jgi:hypothetical protein
MKKHAFSLLILSFSSLYVFSQVDTTKLFYAKKFESAAFVELGSRIIQSNHSAGMDIDFSANWLVKHKYYLGGAYSQLASVEQIISFQNGLSQPDLISYKTNIKYQTAGLRFGYILFPDKKVLSLSPDLTLAWMGLKLQTDKEEVKKQGALISPAVKAVFNVSNYFRIGLALNYNVFVFKKIDTKDDANYVYSSQLSSKDISGLGGGVFLRIGKF